MLNVSDAPKSSYKPPSWSGTPTSPLYIDVIRDGSIIQEHVLEGKSFFIIGSAPTVDIVYQNPLISSEHAVIQFNTEGGSTITDLNSEHGSWTNDLTVPPGQYVPLSSGDRMVFGIKTSRRTFVVREAGDPAYGPEVCRNLSHRETVGKPTLSEKPESQEARTSEPPHHMVEGTGTSATEKESSFRPTRQAQFRLFDAKGKVSVGARSALQIRHERSEKRNDQHRDIGDKSEEPYASWGIYDTDQAISSHEVHQSATVEAKRFILSHVDPTTGFLDVAAVKKSQPTMANLSHSQLSALSKIIEIQRELVDDEAISISTDDEQDTSRQRRSNKASHKGHPASTAALTKDLDRMIRQLAGCSASRDLRKDSGYSSSSDDDDDNPHDLDDTAYPNRLTQAALDAVDNRLFDEDDDFFDRSLSRGPNDAVSTRLQRGSNQNTKVEQLHGRIVQMEKQLAQLDSEIAEGERKQSSRDTRTDLATKLQPDTEDSMVVEDSGEDPLDAFMKVNEAILEDANLKSLRDDRNETAQQLKDLRQCEISYTTPANSRESATDDSVASSKTADPPLRQTNSKPKSNRAVLTASSVLSQIISSKENAKKIKLSSMRADVNECDNDEPWTLRPITRPQ